MQNHLGRLKGRERRSHERRNEPFIKLLSTHKAFTKEERLKLRKLERRNHLRRQSDIKEGMSSLGS